MCYEQTYAEAVRMWREHKSAEPAISYVQDRLTSVPTGQTRGRLLLLQGMFQKRTGALVEALVSHRQALDFLTSSSDRLEVWVSMVDIHVDIRQVEDGYRSAFEAERLLEEVEQQERQRWAPILLYNMGRLAMLHGDYQSARAKFECAIDQFRGTNRLPEGLMAKVRLAESLVALGYYDEAEALCTEVRGCPESPNHALVAVNILLAKIAVQRNNLDKATRAIDRARTHMAEHMGRLDFRVLLDIIHAEADLDEARGDTVGANRLRTLLNEWAGSGYNV